MSLTLRKICGNMFHLLIQLYRGVGMLRAVRYYAVVVSFLPLIALAVYGQQKVDPGNMYYRIWATLPVIGTGKAGDPIRPMLVPNVSAIPNLQGKAIVAAKPRAGILGMQT